MYNPPDCLTFAASWISTQRDAPELDLATGAVVDIGVQVGE